MLTGLFNGLIDNLVCYYLSSLCIVSITIWMIWSYTHSDKWRNVMRDCLMYLTTILISGTVMIIFRNMSASLADNPLIIGIAWFAFAMLFIMELLWLSYAIENILKHFRQSFINFYAAPPDNSRDFRIK